MAKRAKSKPKNPQNNNGTQQQKTRIPNEITQEVSETIDASAISWGTTEDLSDLWDEYITAESREERQTVMYEIREIVSGILGEPPSEWLVKGAPENLDWSDPDSYRHVQRDYMMAVTRFITGADTESASGN